MKCGKCGKEFQTYNGICPFCHTKNEKFTQAKSTIRYTPTVKPQPPDVSSSRNLPHSASTQNHTNAKKTPGNSLKLVLMGGIVLVVVLSVAAVAQLFIGGSPLAASTPDGYISPTPTDVPIPSLTPLTLATQPKITYSGSKAGTLSPYSGDSDPVNPNPPAPIHVVPGHRSTPNISPPESSSTGSDGRSTVVYVTPIPTTIVTVSPPKIAEPPSSPPQVVEPPVTPPKAAKPPTSPPPVVEPPESPPISNNGIPIFVKGTVLGDFIYHENIIHYFLVLDTTYRKDDQGKYTGGVGYRYQRLYKYPLKDGWYLARTDAIEETDEYILGLGMEDPPSATGEVLNVDKVPIEPSYIQPPTPRFKDGDIVKVRENDGSWNTYLIDYYDDSNRYDIYYIAVIVPKVDGTWGYVSYHEIDHPSSAPRRWIDATSNSLVSHLNSRDGIEYIEPPLPIYTPKPPTPTQTPTPCVTGCSFPPYYVT